MNKSILSIFYLILFGSFVAAQQEIFSLQNEITLRKNGTFAQVNMSTNFKVYFNIKPTAATSGVSSIFTVSTRDATNKLYSTDVYFNGNSTRLLINILGSSTPSIIVSEITLPLRSTTEVEWVLFGDTGQLTFNKTMIENFTVSAQRISGKSTFYLSNPVTVPATASVSNFKMATATENDISHYSLVSEREMTKNWYYGKINVPQNLSLSFRIKPVQVSSVTTNILHFTQINADCCVTGTRMPSIYFTAGTTRLSLRVNTVDGKNLNVNMNYDLNLGAWNDVKLRIVGLSAQITINNTIFNYTLTSEAVNGNAFFYASNPWQSAPKAIISNIEIKKDSSSFSNQVSTAATETTPPPPPFKVPNDTLSVRVHVLIISRPSSDAARSVAVALDGYGIQSDLIEIPQTGYTSPLFPLEMSDNIGKYSAIIFPDGEVQYYNSTTKTYASALTEKNWKQLEDYQKKYKTRTVTFDVFPNAAKHGTEFTSGCCELTQEQELYFNKNIDILNEAKINRDARLSSRGLYHYNAKIVNQTLATPLLYADVSAVKKDAGGVVGVLVNRDDGREDMVFYLAVGNFGITSVLLHHIWIHWVAKDVYPGLRQVFLSTQIDDVFLPTGRWDTKLKISNDEKLFRINKTDLDIHAEWTQNLNARLPTGSDFKVELAVNGNGILEHAKLPAAIYLAQTNDDDAPYDFLKPNGTGKSWWPTTVSTDWPENTLRTDSLYNYVITPESAKKFFWLSHTFTHESLNNVSYSDVRNEIHYNQLMFQRIPTEVMKTVFSTSSIVTPRITGLNNGDAIKAMLDLGITNAVGDNTRPNLLNLDKPHWGLTTTPEKNGYRGFYIIPRFATEIYFHCSSTEENMDAYNYIYNKTIGITDDFNTVLDRESERVVRAMLLLKKDPHMFHQANLRVADLPVETLVRSGRTGKYSLLMRWVEHITWKYMRLVNWPVKTVKQEDLFKIFKERESRDNCGIELFVNVDRDTRKFKNMNLRTALGCSVPITVKKNKNNKANTGSVSFVAGNNNQQGAVIESEQITNEEEEKVYWVKTKQASNILLNL